MEIPSVLCEMPGAWNALHPHSGMAPSGTLTPALRSQPLANFSKCEVPFFNVSCLGGGGLMYLG